MSEREIIPGDPPTSEVNLTLIYNRVRNLLGDPSGVLFTDEVIAPFVENDSVGSIPLIAAALADSRGWTEVAAGIRSDFGVQFIPAREADVALLEYADAAVKAERERCAKVAESSSHPDADKSSEIDVDGWDKAAIFIAAKIRSGE